MNIASDIPVAQPAAGGLLQDDAALQGLAELMGKLEPLLAGRRLNRVVDLLSATADLVDMADDYMVEKVAKAFEDGVGGAWAAGNAARMAAAQVQAMEETPTLIGLMRMAREPDVRRGLAFMLAMAGALGASMPTIPSTTRRTETQGRATAARQRTGCGGTNAGGGCDPPLFFLPIARHAFFLFLAGAAGRCP